MQNKTIYYSDPLHDDFARTKIKTVVVDKTFPFLTDNVLYRTVAFLLYYLIAAPIVWLVAKLYLGLRFENRRALRRVKGSFFLYGNHTRSLDAFVPPLAAFPRKAYTVANPDAVSLPFLRHVVLMLGGTPIPTTLSAMPLFLKTLQRRSDDGNCIAIYPEAHIWPFYTGIRPFPDNSFRYPAMMNRPVFAMVTTYRKRRGLMAWCKRPAMTVTLSDPIYPDPSLPRRQAQAQLCRQVYEFMLQTSRNRENIAYYHYVQADGAPPA